MIQIRKATAADIDALIKSRCRTMREVCGFDDSYEFSTEFMEATKKYFLHGNGTTVIATDDGRKLYEAMDWHANTEAMVKDL